MTWRYPWAADQGRRVVTENVKDFRPLVGAGAGPGVRFISSRRFTRSRRNPGPLIDALDHWFVLAAAGAPRGGLAAAGCGPVGGRRRVLAEQGVKAQGHANGLIELVDHPVSQLAGHGLAQRAASRQQLGDQGTGG